MTLSRTWFWLAITVIAGVVLLGGSQIGLLDPFQNAGHTIAAPFQKAITTVTKPVANLIGNMSDTSDLKDQNAQLRTENERLNNEVLRLQESEIQLRQLQQAQGVQQAAGDERYVTAHVIAAERGQRQMVAIDRGKSDGIGQDMIVVTEGRSLVGVVTKAYDNYSWVTLITDPESAIPAIVQESRAQGVAEGASQRLVKLSFIETQDAEIHKGEHVLTSGLGGSYPAGIPIGQVSEVAKNAQQVFQDVRLAPFADLSRVETLLVLVSFKPTKVASP